MTAETTTFEIKYMFGFFKKNTEETTNSLLTSIVKQKGVKPKFHQLKVLDVRKETDDCVSVSFLPPVKGFQYIPGQYITLKKEINGEELRRSYSICSSPLDGELRVAIKRVPDGRFSSWATKELCAGDQIEVMPPMGNFILEPSIDDNHEYVAFAAGSGITPVLSMIKTSLKLSKNSKFTLFYGNKKSSSIIFKRELEDLKDLYLGRFEIHHVLSREDQGNDLLFGRIDKNRATSLLKKFQPKMNAHSFFLCGPETMINNVSDVIADMGVDKTNIHFELFSSTTKTEKTISKPSSKNKKPSSNVTVILDGEKTHFEQPSKTFVLDAALAAGADIPYACKGAVCCTCRAKVLEGSVEMAMNYSLTDEEVDEGYVLSCQTLPKSPDVVISFDD